MDNSNSIYFRGVGKFSGFSSSVLKIIAITAMVLDHGYVLFIGKSLFSVFRVVGRTAFPIFAFMISEGARYSGNKKKYALRLLIFALISEIPYNIAFGSSFVDFGKSNVYFTLLLGLISIWLIQIFREKKIAFVGIFTTVLLAFSAILLNSDYGFMGVIVITLYYLAGEKRGGSRVISFVMIALMTGICIDIPFNPWYLLNIPQMPAVLSAIPLSLYNGKKGFKMNKYVFYWFYPIHIIILTILARVIMS